MKTYNWATYGTGVIANQLAQTMAAAESGHAILAEAMTIYHMPLYKKLHEIAVSGELGPLRMIQMNFGSYKEYDMANHHPVSSRQTAEARTGYI